MAVTFTSHATLKAQADAQAAVNEPAWAQNIQEQINAAAYAGIYTVNCDGYKVTTAIRAALTTAGYTVGTLTAGRVIITIV